MLIVPNEGGECFLERKGELRVLFGKMLEQLYLPLTAISGHCPADKVAFSCCWVQ